MSRLVQLFEARRPLLFAGAHDALSSRLVQDAGFDGVWASGFGITATMGLPDTGVITLTELVDRVAPMQAGIDIPVLVDCDTGFGSAQGISRLAGELQRRGVLGMCVEDQVFPKRNSFMPEAHPLADPDHVCDLISAARSAAPDVAVVARTEALVAGLGREEAMHRGERYAEAGAHALVVHTAADICEPLCDFALHWDGSIPLVAIPTKIRDARAADLLAAGFDVVIFANQALRAAVSAMVRSLASVRASGSPIPPGIDLAAMETVFDLMSPAGARGVGHPDRKDDHLRIARQPAVQSTVSNGFERWRCRHRALPQIDLPDVDLSTEVHGRRVEVPLFVSCMTGGTASGEAVNRNLALAAQRLGLAFGLGSIRPALADRRRLNSFMVRELAPDVPILGNIGIDGLFEHGTAAVVDVMEEISADVVVVHLNPLQEAVQREGSCSFAKALPAIAEVVEASPLPVWAKEVGFGLAPADVDDLREVGVVGFDVAGAGGTNWALVEGHRAMGDEELSAPFGDWGRPTADAVTAAATVLGPRQTRGELLIASGGVRNGVEVVKALALGADLVGVAGLVVGAAADSTARAHDVLRRCVDQARIASFCVGARTVADLDATRLEPRSGT